MRVVNGCWHCPRFVHRKMIFIIKIILIVLIILILHSPWKAWNINNIINIDNIDNMRIATSCGSGKKYKNCCGRNT